MSTSKISLVVGALNFSGEGTEQWLSEQLDKVFSKLEELNIDLKDIGNQDQESSTGGSAPNGSGLGINSIAAKFGVKSGSDLVLVACYSLTRNGKPTATRSEITAEARKATSYFKISVVKNLSNYITTLIKDGKLLEQSSDSYAIGPSAKSEIESKLA